MTILLIMLALLWVYGGFLIWRQSRGPEGWDAVYCDTAAEGWALVILWPFAAAALSLWALVILAVGSVWLVGRALGRCGRMRK